MGGNPAMTDKFPEGAGDNNVVQATGKALGNKVLTGIRLWRARKEQSNRPCGEVWGSAVLP
eukprot:9350035-Prorocentrum_lima.AAC.1